MSPIKTETVTVTAKQRALSSKFTAEYSPPIISTFDKGSPKWVRWLAKYLPFIKVRKSAEEHFAEKMAEEIRQEIDNEVMEMLCAELKKDA